jgi:hypothetical protein
MQPEQPTKGSPLNRAANPLLAPLPNGAPSGRPSGGTSPNASPGGYPGVPPPASGESQPDRRIIVPNGNGTSTVIYPDGRIETIPTPK